MPRFFGLGSGPNSVLIKILERQRVSLDKITEHFEGDLLFNLLTRQGKTYDEFVADTSLSGALKMLIDELKGPMAKIENSRLKLPDIIERIRSGILKTVAVVYGDQRREFDNRINITKAMLIHHKPICTSLITNTKLAERLV